MSTPTPDAATAAVLQALQTLYHDPEASHKRSANEWLEVFQHSVRGRLFLDSAYHTGGEGYAEHFGDLATIRNPMRGKQADADSRSRRGRLVIRYSLHRIRL
jgi:hypothetical protein